MEVKIKYKEIDKKAEVEKGIREYMNRTYPISIQKIVGIVDAIYKEDSKQIESVEIPSVFNECPHIFRADIKQDKHKDSVYMSMPVVWKVDKGTLSEFIDILTTIKNQIEG